MCSDDDILKKGDAETQANPTPKDQAPEHGAPSDGANISLLQTQDASKEKPPPTPSTALDASGFVTILIYELIYLASPRSRVQIPRPPNISKKKIVAANVSVAGSD